MVTSRTMRRVKETAVDSFRNIRPQGASSFLQKRRSYGAADPEGERDGLLIASYNIHKCVGLDGQFAPERTIEVIREIAPDVIALQEVDQRFGRRNGLLDPDKLKAETGLVPVVSSLPGNSMGWHGNVVLSRQGVAVGAERILLPGVEPRGALVVDLELATGPLRIIAAHLGLLRRCRALQIRKLMQAAKPADERPVLLMGDLNEWRLGHRSALRELEPVFGPLDAVVPSFPARYPLWALDRVLASPQSLISSLEVHDTPLAQLASDHLPLKAVIRTAADLDAEREGDNLTSAA